MLGSVAEPVSALGAPSRIPEEFDDALAALTEHQRTVADLVGAGHTNRETAELLGIRAKTVEWNLSRIYRALGVRSRTELAAALARSERTPS